MDMRTSDKIMDRAIVLLYKIDPKAFSYGILGKLFGKHKTTIQHTWETKQDLYDLPEVKK